MLISAIDTKEYNIVASSFFHIHIRLLLTPSLVDPLHNRNLLNLTFVFTGKCMHFLSHWLGFFLLHWNALLHTSLATHETLAKLDCTVLPSVPPYSPDLPPSDFYLCVPIKDTFRGIRFVDEEGVIRAVKKSLRDNVKPWNRQSIPVLVSQRRKAVYFDKNYVEK